jgi:hypothetical protein
MKLTSTMEIPIHNMPCKTNSVHVSLGTSTVSKLDMTGMHTTKPIMITTTLHPKLYRDTSSTSFILILSTALKHRNTSWRELIRTNSVYCVSAPGRHMKMLPSKSLIGSGIRVGRGDFGVLSKGGCCHFTSTLPLTGIGGKYVDINSIIAFHYYLHVHGSYDRDMTLLNAA